MDVRLWINQLRAELQEVREENIELRAQLKKDTKDIRAELREVREENNKLRAELQEVREENYKLLAELHEEVREDFMEFRLQLREELSFAHN